MIREFLGRRHAERELFRNAADQIATDQRLLLEAARSIAMWQHLALESQRATRDIAVAFRIWLETPEVDIRDDLSELVEKLSDQVAQLEEQIVVDDSRV